MGGIAFHEIGRPSPRHDPGVPRPVGAMSARQERTATTIIQDEAGKWRYGPEVPIQVWPVAFLQVDLPDERSLLWSGIEVRIQDREWKNAELTTTLFPYSHDWSAHAPLRPPSNRSAAARMAELQAAMKGDGEQALKEALRSLPFDPFTTVHTKKGEPPPWRYTARLDGPIRLWGLGGIQLDNGHVLARRTNFRHAGAPAEWRFGVCKKVKSALEDTFKGLCSTSDVLAVRNRPGGPRSAVVDAVDKILEAAIWMALAGNHDEREEGTLLADRAAEIAAAIRENAGKRADRGAPEFVSLSDRDVSPETRSRMKWGKW